MYTFRMHLSTKYDPSPDILIAMSFQKNDKLLDSFFPLPKVKSIMELTMVP